METGIKDLKKFFSNKDFIWFDRKELRDAQNLTSEEIKYLKGWSIAPFGFGYILYITLRFLPDILTVYVITYLYSEIDDKILSLLVTSETIGEPLYIGYLAISLLLWAASLYSFYFTFRHGKRLSWNRGYYAPKTFFKWEKMQWKSVQELKDSENKFIKFSVIPSVILLLLIAGLYFFV